jgi:hypothetical protein
MDHAHIRRLLLVGLCALTVLLYRPALGASFVWEDDHALEAPAAWTLPGRGLSQWTVDAIGLDAGRQHAANIGLHLTTGLLVYAVAGEIVAPTAALIAAAVFLLHPINSEAVSYVSARGDLLVALWTLLAVWAALGWADRPGLWRAGVAAISIVAAAMSKEIGLIAIPLVILSLRVFRQDIPLARWIQGALLCALTLAMTVAWPRLVNVIATVPGAGGPVFDLPMVLLLQATAVWHLLALYAWPVGLSIDHDIVGLSSYWKAAACLLTATVAVLAVWARRRIPLLTWAIGWVAICVAPRFVFATSEFIHEYHLYPALTGISIVTGSAVARWCAVMSMPVAAPLPVTE